MENNKLETFEEFKDKYYDKLLSVFKDSTMIDEFFILMEENSSWYDRFEIKRNFEKLFRYMIRYIYFKESQTRSLVIAILHYAHELESWKDCAEATWEKIDIEEDQSCYAHAVRISLYDFFIRDRVDLYKNVPDILPFNFTKDEYANYDFMREFCRINVNKEMPEMVKYVEDII